MATTRLMPMHRTRDHSVASAVTKSIAYVVNPKKTQDGTLVMTFGCDCKTAPVEMMLVKREYEIRNGSERTKANNVILYQIRQAFKPGEIAPEEAQKIGYELAMRFTKGRHQFVVATHVDQRHIHNHILFNSTTDDGTRKFKNFLGSSIAVRHISDRICLAHGVSIVENPSREHMHYGKWLGDRKPLTWQDKLRTAIDAALRGKPASFDAFLTEMRRAGYEIREGKHIAFRAEGQTRFTRLRSLGEDYSEPSIRAVIRGEREHTPAPPTETKAPQTHVDLLVDIQSKLLAGKGAGYERWAKKFNIKQAAQTINYLTEHDLLDYDKLVAAANSASARFSELSGRIQAAEARLKEIAALREHIFNYRKTREIYAEYRKAGYSRKFYMVHEDEIRLHKAAKTAFDALPGKRAPTIKALQEEYAALLSAKKSDYRAYVQTRQEMRDVLHAKANVDTLLGKDKPARENERER